jgi:hypothetical protein
MSLSSKTEIGFQVNNRLEMSIRVSHWCALALLMQFPAFAQDKVPRAVMPQKHLAVLQNYCFDCHDSDSAEAGVNLKQLGFEIDSIASAELWQNVLNAMNAGEMPPKKKRQLSAKEKTAFLADLSQQMVVAREALSDTGGVITMRRLNRREYENTIHDLLGVRVNAEDLPDDANSGGFDTTGNALFFSSDQFEQYLKLAHQAISKAYQFGGQPERKRYRHESETDPNRLFSRVLATQQHRQDQAQAWRAAKGIKAPSAFGFIDANDVRFWERVYRQQGKIFDAYLKDPRTQSGMTLNLTFGGALISAVQIPAASPRGNYILRARVARLPGTSVADSFLEFGQIHASAQKGELALKNCVKVTGTMREPQIIEFPVTVDEVGLQKFGLRQRMHNSREAMRSLFLRTWTKTGLGPKPALWVDWIEVDGPIVESWPPKGFTTLFHKGTWRKKNQDSYAEEIIERFARKAFRIKEPAPSYLEKLYALYLAERQAGKPFQFALKEPLAAILASPGFLYLIEPSPAARGKELNDMELAVRLSYFLWSGPPDEKLLKTATAGELKSKLTWHVNRMLNDPRAKEFISSFTHQWLHMERLDFFQFDSRNFPDFDDSVKATARQEVYQTIQSILKEGGPLSDLLKPGHVVVNDLLASYYDIEGVAGSEFRKVSLPADSPRGGLLGMAAIHAMGSDGERSSPVERGAWVLRKLLDNPPPPAPPNVPQLSRLEDKMQSAREMQSAHMGEAQCAQCHRRIDPIGFGLENFNAAGQWREVERTEARRGRRTISRKEFPIDASGTLPDGTEFNDYFGLRNAIAKKSAAFERGFTEALIEYALGRPYGFSDESLRERILRRARTKNGQLREFIIALVQSKPFRTKK